MNNTQLDFPVPAELGVSGLLASLEDHFNIGVLPDTQFYRVFYDTFDWRLYNHGAALEVRENSESRRVYWRADRHGTPRIQLGMQKVPQLASELPDSLFRRELQAVISVRELLPRIRCRIKRSPLVVLDGDDEVAVRVYLDEHWCQPFGRTAGSALGKRVGIRPVKGYAGDFERIRACLQPMRLPRARENLVALALEESGMSTTDYSNKINLALAPDLPAERALRQILLGLLDIMQQNTAGSIRGRDAEFMHDYRVSIRKTRSALTQIVPVLPQAVVEQNNSFFAGLGKLTNPVRDLDVFLLKLESYQQWLKKPARDNLAPLKEYLAQRREAAQQRFVKTLQTPEYSDRLEQWRDFLEDREPTDPPLDNTLKPVGRLADELIWSMYALSLEEGNVITDDSAPEQLHELRKTCKKLRYLMEFFQGLYPEDSIRELIQAMKGLQDNLGEFNDLHVHAGMLNKFARKSNDARASMASKQLVKALQRRQAKTRSRFAERYAAFASTDNQALFRRLFGGSRAA